MANLKAVRAFFFLLCLFAAGCTKRDKSAAALPAPWLKWTTGAGPESLNWWQCPDKRCRQWGGLIMEGLTRAEFRDSLPIAEPALAENWSDEGALTYTFNIKKDVVWSDGQKLVAADFVNAWRRVLENCGRVAESRILLSIANGSAFCEKKVPFSSVGISAPSPDRLKVRLAQRNPQFPFHVSHPVAWPVRTEKENIQGHLTLGPFRAEKISPSLYRYAANPTYHDGAPALGGIEVRFASSASLRLQAFLDGETDLVDDVPHSLLGQVLGDPRLMSFPMLDLEVLTVSASRRPFHLAAFRKAIAQAIDRKEIPTVLKWPHLPATSLLDVPAAAAADPSFNVAGATRILADLKLDPRLIVRPALVRAPTEESEEVAQNLEAQWIKNLDLKVEIQTAGTGTIEIRSFRPDPYHPLRNLDAFAPLASDPVPRLRGKHFEDLLDDARQARLADSWREYLEKVNDYLVAQEALVVPLYYKSRTVLRRTNLQNIRVDPLGQWDFRTAAIE